MNSKGDLIVLWLYLAKAYGSMPHKLVEEALKRYHVPSSVCDLLVNYYDNFRLRVGSGSTASEWYTLKNGIIKGYYSFYNVRCPLLIDQEHGGKSSRSGMP